MVLINLFGIISVMMAVVFWIRYVAQKHSVTDLTVALISTLIGVVYIVHLIRSNRHDRDRDRSLRSLKTRSSPLRPSSVIPSRFSPLGTKKLSLSPKASPSYEEVIQSVLISRKIPDKLKLYLMSRAPPEVMPLKTTRNRPPPPLLEDDDEEEVEEDEIIEDARHQLYKQYKQQLKK